MAWGCTHFRVSRSTGSRTFNRCERAAIRYFKKGEIKSLRTKLASEFPSSKDKPGNLKFTFKAVQPSTLRKNFTFAFIEIWSRKKLFRLSVHYLLFFVIDGSEYLLNASVLFAPGVKSCLFSFISWVSSSVFLCPFFIVVLLQLPQSPPPPPRALSPLLYSFTNFLENITITWGVLKNSTFSAAPEAN